MKNNTKNSRTKNTFLNISSNFFALVIKTFFMFVTRTVFIYCLGKEALGLNGLFTNVLSMLSLAELGIGQAINFSLYKPLSTNNKDKISSLMSFYRKVYKIIGILVFVIGICLIPFLKFLINDIETIKDVYIIYLLYLLNTGSSYFISYKETLIIADQKKYEIIKIEAIFTVFLNLIQIIVLMLTKNFVFYLVAQFCISFLQRIITNIYITKKYNYIDFKTLKRIDTSDKETIKKNVKAMFFHKIGDYCINGTDNLIISSFISITAVGLYSNYLTIITLLNSFVSTIYNGLTASLGNLIATENYDKRYIVFNKMNFVSFILHGFSFVILINIFNDFITIWIGKDYCLNFSIVLCLLISFYLTGMRVSCSITKTAAGIYDIDKFTPLIQAIINLVVSILFVKKIGLLGVILGTIISSIVLPSWQRPHIVYKYVLNRSSKEYFINYFKYIFVIAFTSILSLTLFNYFKISNLLLFIVIKIIIISIIFFGLITFLFNKKEEYNYIYEMIRGVLHGKRIS